VIPDLPHDLEQVLERETSRLGPFVVWRHLSTTPSTNDVAATLAREPGAVGAVVIADEQTSGRGRRGRTWTSRARCGLYVSVVLAPEKSVDARRALSLVTIGAGVALAEGLKAATGLGVSLKWPNDLYVHRRKLGGILAEAAGDDRQRVVLGFGVNLLADALTPELRDRATSLDIELGRVVDRGDVLAGCLAALSRRYDDLLRGRFDAILDAWRRLAPMASGAQVTWSTPSGPRAGTTAGIDSHGALLVSGDGGVERLVAGEVVWL
jgi:BirA family biotin operon repressor/biotin-[acetyl-CoA-carboxylase] ligase